MEDIISPDDTLSTFSYLDRLSKIEDSDIIKAIEDWEKRTKTEEKNILIAEVINNG